MPSPDRTAEQPNEVTWAVALVHGIGTTEPMRMITEVSEAIRLARPELGLMLGHEAEVHVVREPRDLERLEEEIAAEEADKAPHRSVPHPATTVEGTKVRDNIYYNVIRHGRLFGGTLRIGTAHWADITYYRQGFINLIGALMMTAFGVRFFAEVAARTDGQANPIVRALAWVQRTVLGSMVWIIAAVVFPVTFVTLIYSLMALLGIYVFRTDEVLRALQKELIALLGLAICVSTAWIGYRRSREFGRERPMGVWIFGALGICGAALGIAMFLGDFIWVTGADAQNFQMRWRGPGAPEPPQPFVPVPLRMRDVLVGVADWFGNAPLSNRIRVVDETGSFLALLHGLQLVTGVLLLFLTLLAVLNLAVLGTVAKLTGHSARTFVFATVSVITIWIINLVLLWPENLATFAAMTHFLDDRRSSDMMVLNGLATDRWGWETLTFALKDSIGARPGFMKDRLYSDTYPVLWFEAMFLVFLALTTLLAFGMVAARKAWCFLNRAPDLSRFAPRLGAPAPANANWPRLIVARGYVWLVIALIIVVPGTLAALIVNATKLGDWLPFLNWLGQSLPHDISIGAEWARIGVITFIAVFLLFSHYIRDGAKLLLDVVNHFAAPHLGYPVRKRINRRFVRMIDKLLEQDDKPNLVIIAHSQGTVITLDALMNEEWVRRVLPRVETLTVLTFGSPITHVYQQYFPEAYKPLKQTSLARLSLNDRVKWINVYRIDDFVGTWVDPSIPSFPVNVPVPIGGHTKYWSKDVFEALFSNQEMQTVLASLPPPR